MADLDVYTSSLSGEQMDSAMEDMVEHNSEAWAVGQRNGTDVGSTDETYHNNAKYYAESVEDSSEDAESWAVGQRGGTDVPSTDPAYHNNAKYYADNGTIRINGTSYQVRTATSGSGATGYITFILEA